MTSRTGTIGEFMQWTKRVIADPKATADDPRQWFDSDETAARRVTVADRAEALVKLLSEENRTLLHLIDSRHPRSLRELADMAGRKTSNLSRTLKKLEEAGLVGFVEGDNRTRAPRLLARRITLELDLVGKNSAVSLDGPMPA